MKHKLRCILLIDDNPDDNFFHERVIRKNNYTNCVIAKESAEDALDYLKAFDENQASEIDLIFLDINMPRMNGWDFLDEYNKLDKELQRGVIVIMLTTSDNPDDIQKAMKWGFTNDFKTKPLTKKMMDEIIDKYFLIE